MTGRAKFDGTTIEDIYPGRWGDVTSLYSTLSGPSKDVYRYPRPGRSDNQNVPASPGDGVRYGGNSITNGRGGYDDTKTVLRAKPLHCSANTGRLDIR